MSVQISSQKRPYKLSVVIPTYNEATRLPRTLSQVIPYLERTFADHEIVIVDDQSPDKTLEVVARAFPDYKRFLMLTQPGRVGKGAAVRTGCLAASGDLVLFMDADHSTQISEVEEFLPHLVSDQDRLIAGMRVYQDDESKWRRVIGILSQLAAHLIVLQKAVIDTQCGFKLFTRGACRKIFSLSRINGGMLDVEIFYLAHKQGLTCRFVPVSWKNDPNSHINFWLCIIRDPLALVKIRINDWMGLYDREEDEA